MANLKIKEGITLSGIDSQTREVLNSFAQIGMVLPFLGPITQTSSSGVITTTAPFGWLLCNGNTFLNTNYPQLAAVLGSTVLPNLQGKHIAGTNTSGLVGSNFGNNTHTHTESYGASTVSSVTMDAHETTSGAVNSGASATNHDHANNIGANIDYLSNSTFVNFVSGTQSNIHRRTHQHSMSVGSTSGIANDNHSHSITRSASGFAQTPGAASEHNHSTSFSGSIDTPSNLVPTIYVNYIIKADK